MEETERLYKRKYVISSLINENWNGNEGTIKRFYESVNDELSTGRIARLLQILKTADKFFRESFDNLKSEDFERYHEHLKKNMTPQSVYTYMVGLKQFFKWLGKGIDIKLSRPKCPYTSEDMYTEEEQNKMIQTAKGLFWKAFLDGLRYSRCRPGEFILLKRKDIQINEMGIILSIPKRKNSYSERSVIIKEDCPYFRKWIKKVHDPERYLFLRDGWTYSEYDRRFKKIIREAGIKKRFARLYLFRHTRYTKDCDIGVSSEVRDALYGHSPETRLRSYYNHLDQLRINKELDRAYENNVHSEKIVVMNPLFFGANN